MTSFTFNPFVGTDHILFDEERESVRKIGDYSEFKKNKFSKNTTDDFGGFHVYYNEVNRVEAIEFFPDTSLIYMEKDLFTLSPIVLAALLNDQECTNEDSFLSFPNYGMEVVCENEHIISIFIHIKDY